jgi:hypothetical protein
MQGKLSDKEIKRRRRICSRTRSRHLRAANPAIISDGFMAQPQQGLGNAAGDNEKAARG